MNNSEPKTKKNEIIDLIKFTIITLLIIIPIRMFIAQPFIVNGESMVPTFNNGDYLIIDELSYHTNDPQRGEVVVFKFPTDNKRFLIKRVVGLPGETITLNGDQVTILTNEGEQISLDETYLSSSFSTYGNWELGNDEYFVMGDNRSESSDSRSWGVLKEDNIIGKTFLRLFPLSGISVRPGEVDAKMIEVSTQ
jgi:signal peptidase I